MTAHGEGRTGAAQTSLCCRRIVIACCWARLDSGRVRQDPEEQRLLNGRGRVRTSVCLAIVTTSPGAGQARPWRGPDRCMSTLPPTVRR